MHKACDQLFQSSKVLCYICWEWINISGMYIVDILVYVMCNKACVECLINFFIVVGSARHNFCSIGGVMSCCQEPSSLFSFISIHRDWWSPTSLPKDKIPPWFATRVAEK